MLAMRALSTAFWSAARLLLTSFFCYSVSKSLVAAWTGSPYLGLLSLLEERLFSGLFLDLLRREVFWL